MFWGLHYMNGYVHIPNPQFTFNQRFTYLYRLYGQGKPKGEGITKISTEEARAESFL
jgi:hypothetical protein